MNRHVMYRVGVSIMALWMTVLGFSPSNAFSFPSESLPVVGSASIREAQIRQILAVLSRPEARMNLRLLGIGDRQVKDALQKLDDAQLDQLSKKADAVKAGGDGLGIVIAVLVIVLLIILIVNLMDKRIEIKDAKK